MTAKFKASATSLFTIFLLLTVVSASAEIYRWVDSQGKVHFTDKPPQAANTKTVKLKINSFTSPSVENFKFDDKLITKRKASVASVVMYSTEWCGYCKQASSYFRQNNIAFTEYDIEKSDKGKRDYQKMNGKGVPIILVGNKRMNGFSPGVFEQVYRQ